MMKKILVLIGLLTGGYIGFLNRPSVLLVGQLPFEKVILAGSNLKGLDQVFINTARTSFYYMLIGASAGLVAGLILAAVITGKRS
jgi:hypothetical protein